MLNMLILTGKVPMPERAEVVDSFNKRDWSPTVMFVLPDCRKVVFEPSQGQSTLVVGPALEPFKLRFRLATECTELAKWIFIIYKSSETIEERILKLQTQKLQQWFDWFNTYKITLIEQSDVFVPNIMICTVYLYFKRLAFNLVELFNLLHSSCYDSVVDKIFYTPNSFIS